MANQNKLEEVVWECPICKNKRELGKDEYSKTFPHEASYLDGSRQTIFSEIFICTNMNCKNVEFRTTIQETKLVEIKTTDINYMVSGRKKTEKRTETIKAFSYLTKDKFEKYRGIIPDTILKDYEEAYLISELSPRASTVLIRRCIQGIIREQHQTRENNLKKEIDELLGKISPEFKNAFDCLRLIGNIGAHPEADIYEDKDISIEEIRIILTAFSAIINYYYINIPLLKNIQNISDSKKTIKDLSTK